MEQWFIVYDRCAEEFDRVCAVRKRERTLGIVSTPGGVSSFHSARLSVARERVDESRRHGALGYWYVARSTSGARVSSSSLFFCPSALERMWRERYLWPVSRSSRLGVTRLASHSKRPPFPRWSALNERARNHARYLSAVEHHTKKKRKRIFPRSLN